MSNKKQEPPAYRALTGINYPKPDSEEGEEIRLEPGDKFTELPDDVFKALRKGQEYEVWRERQTENVRGDDFLGESIVHGVTSRHYKDELRVKGVDENGTEPR